jgi:signal transduction histidine kinase
MDESHSQFALDHICVGTAQLDPTGQWLGVDEALCELLRVPLPQLLLRPFDEAFRAGDPAVEQSLRARLVSGLLSHYWSEREVTTPGGRSLPVKVKFSLARSKSGEDGNVILAVVVDVTALRTAEEALRESETARHELARRLTNAQEKERTRIARELHDDIGQALAILRIQMLRAGQPVSGMIGKRHPTIPQLCDNLKMLAEKVSRISHQLHSAELEYLGLAVAVQGHCREFSEKYKIPVECTCAGIPEDLDDLVALSLLRIVQEALYNAGKYSQAGSIQVALEASDTDLSLLISDDGVGFDPEEAKLAAGLGLISMRERTYLAGGEFKILSEPGQGTCIMVRIPLASAEEQPAAAAGKQAVSS